MSEGRNIRYLILFALGFLLGGVGCNLSGCNTVSWGNSPEKKRCDEEKTSLEEHLREEKSKVATLKSETESLEKKLKDEKMEKEKEQGKALEAKNSLKIKQAEWLIEVQRFKQLKKKVMDERDQHKANFEACETQLKACEKELQSLKKK